MHGPIAKIPRLNSMIEALNAYNAREPNRRRRAWGWVEPKVLNIPHRSEDITGDPTYDPSSTGPGDNHNIFEDFSEQWPSLVTWPRRPIQTSPGCVKYRLAFFIHKHPPREHDAVDRNLNTSYSVSIWDREVCTPTEIVELHIFNLRNHDTLTYVLHWKRITNCAGMTLGLITAVGVVVTLRNIGLTARPAGETTASPMWISPPSYRSITDTVPSRTCRAVRTGPWSRDSRTGPW